MRRTLADPLGHALLALALALGGCDTAGPPDPPAHPGLRACPLCGRGMEWAGRYYWCEHCRGPIL